MPNTSSEQAIRFLPQAVIDWQRIHGRHELPWQQNFDPYRIWLSEIMLQQTQVETVIPYYEAFLQAFPNVQSLAQASQDEVLRLWAGLGYYARARNLHACAQTIVSDWHGQFPDNAHDLETLPGIGRSTAGAIAAFSFGQRTPILDGNVRRVFCRYFGIDTNPMASATQKQLWALAQETLPKTSPEPQQTADMRSYIQGLMDLGATVCRRNQAKCTQCPLQNHCIALKTERVNELPIRQVRKARTEQTLHLFVFKRGAEIYLIKRAQARIWGGLWSLPQTASPEIWQTAFKALNLNVLKMAARTHDLTHIKLTLKPWLIEITDDATMRELHATLMADIDNLDEQSNWVDPATWEDYGVPKPVRDILLGFMDEPLS